MYKLSFILLILVQLNVAYAQDVPITLKVTDGEINGSLLLPNSTQKLPLVLIIAGSGPTDRNGNQGDAENNSLKYLAEELYKNNIASVRYDKRSVGTSIETEEDLLRFDTYVNDVRRWITMLSKDTRFSKIIIAGHSEGSLLGIIAAQKNRYVKGFISIAGAGRPADEIIKEQLAHIHESVKPTIFSMIDAVKKGDTLADVPIIFYSLFRPSIQKYMTSWFRYNPTKELKKLTIPVLITQGDKDMQVKITDAELLSVALPKAQVSIIKNMNHILKECDTMDKQEQTKQYSKPSLPIKKELITVITKFIDELKITSAK